LFFAKHSIDVDGAHIYAHIHFYERTHTMSIFEGLRSKNFIRRILRLMKLP
jgi:hypothetical protein